MSNVMEEHQLRQRLHEIARARRSIRRQAAQWQHEADVLRRKADEMLAADLLLAEEEEALSLYLEKARQVNA